MTDPVTLFQPIVSLADEYVVGYEALSRWPSIVGASPDAVFAHAAAAGTAGELDRRCTRAAVDAALAANFSDDALLMINTEPTTAARSLMNVGSLQDARDRYQVVFELTERNLLAHPGALLAKVAALRAAGVSIALDDVGGDVDVLPWLDVIDPDVIKLDLSLIQGLPVPEQARVLNAVFNHHDRSGALIVAEGIETDVHLDQALAVGATLGQGYRFGYPVPGEQVATARGGRAPELSGRIRRPRIEAGTPFDLVSRHGAETRVARRDLLEALSYDFESQAERAPDRPIVLLAMQRFDLLSAATIHRYRRMAESSSLVTMFAPDLPVGLDAGVTGVPLRADDPLGHEWALVALGPQTAFALAAREIRDSGTTSSHGDRRFVFAATTDRALIASVATSLLSRIP